MTDIDDDVRSLLATAAELITQESVPPLRLPEARVGERQQPVVRGLPRWLGPAAAAASVAAIAAASLVISNAVTGRRGPVSLGGVPVPPYYIAITTPERGAAIYATRTGELIARVVPPASSGPVIGVSAAADDRTFAMEVSAGKGGIFRSRPSERFYLVRFNPATRAVEITTVPAPQALRDAITHGFALSPSGTKLAVAYLPLRTPKFTDELAVVTLRTGVIRTWTSSRGEVLNSQNPMDLSWAADDSTLAFNWFGFTLTPQRTLPTSGFWLLDTAKPGGDLIADSRQVLRYEVGAPDLKAKDGYFVAQPMLAPDGRTVVAAITSKQAGSSGYFWFVTYDAANGRVEHEFDRTSLSRTPLGWTFGVFWSSPFGRQLVVAGAPGHRGQLAILRQSGQVTVLPHDQKLSLRPGPAW